MRLAGSAAVIRRIISLFETSPGTIANRPPRSCLASASTSKRSFVSRRALSGPWHVKHLSESRGLISRLNSTACARSPSGVSSSANASIAMRMGLPDCRAQLQLRTTHVNPNACPTRRKLFRIRQRPADVAAPLESGTSIRIMPSCRDVRKSSPSRLRLMCRSARAAVAPLAASTSSRNET